MELVSASEIYLPLAPLSVPEREVRKEAIVSSPPYPHFSMHKWNGIDATFVKKLYTSQMIIFV